MSQLKNTIRIINENTATIWAYNTNGQLEQKGLIFHDEDLKVLGKFSLPNKGTYYALTRDYFIGSNAVVQGSEVEDYVFFKPGEQPLSTDANHIWELYWQSLSYDKTKMNWGIEEYKIIDTFWKKGYRGEGIKIAVIDSGVQIDHPSLKGQFVLGADGKPLVKDFTGSGNTKDMIGHGTQCAGLIAANGVNCFGLAPKAKIMVGKVVEDNNYWSIESLNNAIEWAIMNRADIISISLEKPEDNDISQDEKDKLTAKVNDAVNKGILIVAASGNYTKFSTSYPGKIENIFTMGAHTKNNIRITSNNIKKVDLLLPGENIKTLTNNNELLIENFNQSSCATAYMSGLAALMLQRNRNSNSTYKAYNLKAELITKRDSNLLLPFQL